MYLSTQAVFLKLLYCMCRAANMSVTVFYQAWTLDSFRAVWDRKGSSFIWSQDESLLRYACKVQDAASLWGDQMGQKWMWVTGNRGKCQRNPHIGCSNCLKIWCAKAEGKSEGTTVLLWLSTGRVEGGGISGYVSFFFPTSNFDLMFL